MLHPVVALGREEWGRATSHPVVVFGRGGVVGSSGGGVAGGGGGGISGGGDMDHRGDGDGGDGGIVTDGSDDGFADGASGGEAGSVTEGASMDAHVICGWGMDGFVGVHSVWSTRSRRGVMTGGGSALTSAIRRSRLDADPGRLPEGFRTNKTPSPTSLLALGGVTIASCVGAAPSCAEPIATGASSSWTTKMSLFCADISTTWSGLLASSSSRLRARSSSRLLARSSSRPAPTFDLRLSLLLLTCSWPTVEDCPSRGSTDFALRGDRNPLHRDEPYRDEPSSFRALLS
jgi:hypothetical protein